MKSLVKWVLSVCSFMAIVGSLPASAENVTVTVTCSNGQNVANLPISVVDSAGTTIPGAVVTDSSGSFLISNSEGFVPPFYLSFQSLQGSACGAYYIYVNSENVGVVSLNYYPTNVPCSCAALTGN